MTTTALPRPPQEPPACTSSNGLAPRFRDKVITLESRMTGKGWHITRRETWRSDERADWLFEFGRTYDDGRGIVTNARTAAQTWHHYWLAVDYGDSRYEPGNEPPQFWIDLREVATGLELVCGADWRMKDRPHVQWGAPMRVSPSDRAAQLLRDEGIEAVWREVGAAG